MAGETVLHAVVTYTFGQAARESSVLQSFATA
jgi:hypothetical protein